jgi:phosphoribosylanthranilate isomerase
MEIIKSLIVHENNLDDLINLAESLAPLVDAFITDTFDPITGATGATGKTHNWAISRALVEHAPKPVILAGGLTPGNVAQAICTVRPWGVDCHTGVEGRDGRKDYTLVRAFVMEAEKAFGKPGR